MPDVKICGLREPANIDSVAELNPNYLGFIFFAKSPRFVADRLLPVQLKNIPSSIKKVGVFVNEPVENISQKVQELFLNAVQLHGDETTEDIKQLRAKIPGIEIIKAFSVDEDFDFSVVDSFAPLINLVLFDTVCSTYGGSGKSFSWEILQRYNKGPKFILSGGLGADNVEQACKLVNDHPLGEAIDASSKLEKEPGLKSISLVNDFIKRARA